MVQGHVERDLHRADAAGRLGQQVAALQGRDQAGGEPIRVRPGRSATSLAIDPRAQPWAPFWVALRRTSALRQRSRPLNELSRDSCASSRASTRSAHSPATARTTATLSGKWW